MTAADSLLAKYPNEPLQALWDSLNDPSDGGATTTIAIVRHPDCGINHQVPIKDGIFVGLPRFSDNEAIPFATPLTLAAFAGRADVIGTLLMENPSEQDLSAALHAASAVGCVAAIDVLLAHGVPPATTNSMGNTPLHFAAECGQVSAIEALIGKGAPVAASNSTNDTALHCAARFGQIAALNLLIDKGAPLEAIGMFGSPLHCAAMYDQSAAVEALIVKGAACEAVNMAGNTPLHMAALRGSISAIEVLIARGACVSSVNKNGLTPLQLATLVGQTLSAELLGATTTANASTV